MKRCWPLLAVPRGPGRAAALRLRHRLPAGQPGRRPSPACRAVCRPIPPTPSSACPRRPTSRPRRNSRRWPIRRCLPPASAATMRRPATPCRSRPACSAWSRPGTTRGIRGGAEPASAMSGRAPAWGTAGAVGSRAWTSPGSSARSASWCGRRPAGAWSTRPAPAATGPWLDPATVLPAMFHAALQGFPNPPAGPRRVDIQLGGESRTAAAQATAPRLPRSPLARLAARQPLRRRPPPPRRPGDNSLRLGCWAAS